MYELYVYLPSLKSNTVIKTNELNQYRYGLFKPTIFHLWLDGMNYKQWLKNLYWLIITKSNYRIYYVYDKDKIIHTSYCVYKCYKFPFMKNTDVQVGPCNTSNEYQGKGIYSFVLSRIVSDYHKEGLKIYMIIRKKNISSKKGALKAGFRKTKNLSKNDFLKTYKVVD